MPTYVYKFTDTGETVEVQQAFTDPTLTEYPHPIDGTVRAVKKVFMPVGVTFKGSGFYKTDSRGSGSKSTASTSATEGSSTSNGSGTSSDTSSSTPSSTPASTTSSSTASTPSSTGAAAG